MKRRRFATWKMMVFQLIVFTQVAVASSPAWSEESAQAASDKTVGKSETATEKSAVSDVDPDVFVNAKAGIRLERAGGWLAGVPSQGAVALFRAAGESQAQIEFRVSEGISEELLDGYISAFNNSLLRVGFIQIETKEKSNYGGRIGSEYEYRVLSDGREFRLIAWLYGHDDSVWIVTGFFPLSKRDAYFRGFQSMLKSLEFTDR